MADETRIIDWALARAERLKFKATPLTRVGEWLPGFHDYLVQIAPFGQVYEGRGTDQSETAALTKAIVEAFERLLKDRMGLATTNGLSGHSSPEGADFSARLELIERDAFLCHYLTKTPFYPISLAGFEKLPDFLRNAALCCATRGVRLEIRELRRIHDAYTVIAVALGSACRPAFGVVLGCASSVSFLSALEHAILECVRNVIAVLDGNGQAALSHGEFLGLDRIGPMEQDRLALSPEAAEEMLPYLNLPASDVLSRWADHGLELTDIGVESIDTAHYLPELDSFPVCFARAYSDALQPLFFGQTRAETVNLSRLGHFAGRSISLDDLQGFPHFFG